MNGFLAAREHYTAEMIAETKRVVQLPDYSLTSGYVSENFYFMYNGSGFLACEQWPDFTDAGGKTGASLKAGFRSQLITAFNRIVTGNLYEHGSPVYYVTSIVPIRMIAEFAQDPEVKRKAWATLDALMLHLACDWNQGYYATAAARCKGWSNITGSPQAMNASQTTGWLFYGGYRPITISTSDFAHSIWMAFPRQYETPPAFQQVATRRSMSFQHRSSTWGGTNSDFKNVWHTPEYTLSSMYEIFSSSQNGKEQQPVCFKWLSDKQESTIIIGSENHIQFYNSGRTNSLSFFPYDPARNSMGYGTNPYMQHFQHRQTLVGVGNVSPWYANSHPDLTAEEAAATPEIDPLYFAELYLPLTQKGAILKTLEDSASGWLFCHAGSTLFAFWTHSPYYWGADIAGARMLRSKALKNAWILETAATSDYPSAVGVDAQLDAFKADVLSNGAINSSNVATTLPRLHYTSIHGYALDLTWRPHQTDNFWVRGRFTEPKGWPADAWKYTNQAKVDGIAVEYDGTSWPLLGNPWVTQQGGANNLAIDIDDIRTTYKFTTNASTWGRPPSLDKVAPLIIGRGNSIAIPLQVADEETGAGSVSLAVTAENEALLPASSLVFSGSGAERTLTISAPPGLTGITSLQLTATDPDGATWSQTIPVTIGSGPLVSIVNPGPDPFPLPAGVLIGNLSAAITDPGSAPVTSTLWSLFSGPAAVTFGNASALETSVTFTSPGTYVLQFAATSSEATGLGHVTLVVGQPVYGGDLIFGATPGDPAVETVNVTENTIYDRLLVQTASSAPNILNIGAGITATIDGNAVLNPGASGTSATKLNVIGATGTLAITNTASGSILLGSNFSGAVNTSTLDMSQLGTFTASLGSSGSGVFNIGIGTTSTASTPTTVILANTSTVTAPSIRVGAPSGGGNAGTVALKLGSGTNMLNTDTFHIGTYFNGGRSGGSVTFNSATGSLILRSANGSGRADVNLVNNQGGSTGTAVTGTMDLGGSPDASTHLLIDDLNLAARTGGGSCTATMTHRAGVLDVNTLRMSQIANSISTSSLGVTSTLNLNGGTVAFNSLVSIGSNNLASTSSGTGATGTATLNIAGAAVTSIAPSFILGNRSGSAGGNVVAALNLSAGSLTLGSDIIRIDNAVGIGTTTKSTLTLNGGTLNMAGYDIGDSIHPISFIAQSGTLNHPGTINGTGGLTKTTAGTLILHAATYTGNTTVADGTLQLTGTNLPDSSALVIGTGTGSPAMLHLPDAGSDTVATLIIDGVTMPAGLYGSTNSGGAITGSGTIEVTAFSTWIQSFPGISGAAGNPLADSDSDGLNNIAEFALDGNPVSGASTGKVVGRTVTVGGNPALVLTIPVRQGAVFSGTTDLVSNPIDGVIYKIEGSGQLNEWDLTISEVAGPDATAIHAGMPALSAGWSYRTFQSPAAPSMQRKFLRAAILTP
jgi:autotransporter-associated beta strand protein